MRLLQQSDISSSWQHLLISRGGDTKVPDRDVPFPYFHQPGYIFSPGCPYHHSVLETVVIVHAVTDVGDGKSCLLENGHEILLRQHIIPGKANVVVNIGVLGQPGFYETEQGKNTQGKQSCQYCRVIEANANQYPDRGCHPD